MKTRLAELRRQAGHTQDSFAEILGIPASTYNTYENSTRNVPKERAEKIARELNVKVEEIFLPLNFTVSKAK